MPRRKNSFTQKELEFMPEEYVDLKKKNDQTGQLIPPIILVNQNNKNVDISSLSFNSLLVIQFISEEGHGLKSGLKFYSKVINQKWDLLNENRNFTMVLISPYDKDENMEIYKESNIKFDILSDPNYNLWKDMQISLEEKYKNTAMLVSNNQVIKHYVNVPRTDKFKEIVDEWIEITFNDLTEEDEEDEAN